MHLGQRLWQQDDLLVIIILMIRYAGVLDFIANSGAWFPPDISAVTQDQQQAEVEILIKELQYKCLCGNQNNHDKSSELQEFGSSAPVDQVIKNFHQSLSKG